MLGRRTDGLHLLGSLMVSISLSDLVFVETDAAGEGPAAGPYAGAVSGADDLATRAWLVLRELSAAVPQAQVSLHKRIPAGAGLGGGSADAAAILRLGAGLAPQISPADLAAAAMKLGADVPFQLGGGAAFVSGAGEEIRSLPARSLEFAVCWPRLHSSTAAVFAAVEASDHSAGAAIDEAARVWSSGSPAAFRELLGALPNGLFEPALRAYPELGDVRERLAAAGWRPRLTGSGASFFHVCDDPGTAGQLAAAARALGYDAWAVRTLPPFASATTTA